MTSTAEPARLSSAQELDQFVQKLKAGLEGDVYFDAGNRALYATDASNYRQVPIGVVAPRTAKDVETTVAIADEFNAPILMRGAGTSLAGQTCNVAIVLDVSRYLNRITELDPDARLARVEPGVVCDSLRNAAEEHGLTFGPDPSTHTHCTLGGMIGNNSCGAHSVMSGKTVDNIESLDVLTYDGLRLTVGPTSEDELERIVREGGRRGEIYAALRNLRDRYADAIRNDFPQIRRRVSGYNLDALLPENGFNVAAALIGTEGTCAITLSAQTRLIPSPPHRTLVVLGYEDICEAGDRAPEVLATGPLALEGIDDQIVADMRKKGMGLKALKGLPDGDGWLLAEYGGDSEEQAQEKARKAIEQIGEHCVDSRLYTDPVEANLVWSVRKSGAAATNALPGEPETYPGWEDAAVDPAQVGDYLRDYRKLLGQYGYRSSLYGHFGDGCIHGRVTFDMSSAEGVAKWRRFTEEAADLVVRYGGSLSGEHGDGQARAELWPRMFSDELMAAFREFKAIWDPEHRLNPHKLIDPYRLDENLRTGPDHNPAEPQPLYFSFHKDEGSFAAATGRCVGVGKCRSQQGGTMCPSYRGRWKKNTAPEAAPDCSSRCWKAIRWARSGTMNRSTKPWICAWAARPVNTSVRYRWTWPLTRPNSWPTIMRSTGAPGRLGSWAGFTSGPGWPEPCPESSTASPPCRASALWYTNWRALPPSAHCPDSHRARIPAAIAPNRRPTRTGQRYCCGLTPSATTLTRGRQGRLIVCCRPPGSTSGYLASRSAVAVHCTIMAGWNRRVVAWKEPW